MRLPIDINQAEFLPVEKHLLGMLLDKHEQYLAQGRDLEAKGVERAVHIVWNGLKGEYVDTRPTGWADIER